MKSVVVCPKCKNLVYFNSYFGAYICENCNWEDDSYAQERDSYVVVAKAAMKVRLSDHSGSILIAKKRRVNAKKISAVNKKSTATG